MRTFAVPNGERDSKQEPRGIKYIKINFNFFFRKVCGNKKGLYLCTPIRAEGKKEEGWKQ